MAFSFKKRFLPYLILTLKLLTKVSFKIPLPNSLIFLTPSRPAFHPIFLAIAVCISAISLLMNSYKYFLASIWISTFVLLSSLDLSLAYFHEKFTLEFALENLFSNLFGGLFLAYMFSIALFIFFNYVSQTGIVTLQNHLVLSLILICIALLLVATIHLCRVVFLHPRPVDIRITASIPTDGTLGVDENQNTNSQTKDTFSIAPNTTEFKDFSVSYSKDLSFIWKKENRNVSFSLLVFFLSGCRDIYSLDKIRSGNPIMQYNEVESISIKSDSQHRSLQIVGRHREFSIEGGNISQFHLRKENEPEGGLSVSEFRTAFAAKGNTSDGIRLMVTSVMFPEEGKEWESYEGMYRFEVNGQEQRINFSWPEAVKADEVIVCKMLSGDNIDTKTGQFLAKGTASILMKIEKIEESRKTVTKYDSDYEIRGEAGWLKLAGIVQKRQWLQGSERLKLLEIRRSIKELKVDGTGREISLKQQVSRLGRHEGIIYRIGRAVVLGEGTCGLV